MFDTKKIQQLTSLLEQIPENFSDVYIVPENFPKEAAALFKRLKLPVRAVMHDTTTQKDFWGIPVIKTAEAVEKFNERTVLIVLTQKPVPFIQTTFDIKKRGGLWTVPALVMTNEEAYAVYDRLTISKILQQYKEDGISSAPTKVLSDRLARGLTTFLEPTFQNFKYQLWDSRLYFKPTYTFNDTAIVIQGPIEYANNYTADTFKFYRSIYPKVPIVVSTWKGEATNDFRRECRENSVVLLESEPPEFAGPANINLQLKSSLQGVKYVKENISAKFVLKTRTDQRINYFSFLVYFKNLLKTFPPKGNKLRERIIFIGSQTTLTAPFNFHDFISFGHVEDISKLYDIPFHGKDGNVSYLLRHRKRSGLLSYLTNSPKHRVDYNFMTEQRRRFIKLTKFVNRIWWPEMYIARSFYEKYIAPVDPTKFFETSWKFTVDYLILVDFETIQLDWPKYEKMRYKLKFDYFGQTAFARWLDMYKNFKMD